MSRLPDALTLALLCAVGSGAPLAAQEAPKASGDFVGLDGAGHGSATLTQTENGVLIRMELTGLPEGILAVHVHEAGACEPPFDSAGGHFNPAGAAHGYLPPEGPHAGDLPNLHVPASGALTAEAFTDLVSLEQGSEASLFDEDGSALIIHARADDYASQPSGDAGERIACAVLGE